MSKLLLITIVPEYCYTRVLLYAKMLNETEKEETRFFLSHFFIDGFRLGFCPPNYVYHCNFNAICDIKILCAFLLLCACQSDTNGFIFYDHAKYAILLVKVKIG